VRKKRFLFFSFILIFLFWADAFPQYYFGKNKVNYTDFEWHVLTTQHFKVYFYPEEKEIAEIAGNLAEKSYKILEDKFNHHIFSKIPLIVYSSPNYFQQTNVIPNLIPESVGGFTEFYKGRMVIPFNGSYADFERVIRHELVHVFSFSKLNYVMKSHKKYNFSSPPLWWEEGLAEHFSKEWDSEADMLVKDLVLSGRLVKLRDMGQIYGTYFMYKEGESFLNFLAQEYGEDKISSLYENYWKGNNFYQAVENTFDKPLDGLGEDWEYHLKKEYFPQIEGADLPERTATQLTFEGFNLKPSVVSYRNDKGEENWIAFKSNKLGYSSIYLMSPQGEKEKLKILVKGERSQKFESLHLLKSKIDTSPDGRITFVSKRDEKDVLYIYDIEKRKVIQNLAFDSLVCLSSPCWSPDQKKIVFSGVTQCGYCDLYTVNLNDGTLIRLTRDVYEDVDPCWSADGKSIVFSSDRGEFGNQGYNNLFVFDLFTQEIEQITFGPQNDLNPSWLPDGKRVVFSSDREGAFNLFLLNDSLRIYQLTSLTTGAFDPVFVEKESCLVFTGYQDQRFQIYKMKFPEKQLTEVDNRLYSSWSSWEPEKLKGKHKKGIVKYKNQFSFDIAQSAIAYDAVYGPIGGLQVAFTDMLGNHQYFFLLGNSAQSKSEFLSSFNLAVTYLNKTKRLNHGLGLYHFYDEYYDDFYGWYKERQYGGMAFASYPLSKFRRVETSFFLRQSDKDLYMLDKKRHAFLSTNYLSFIKDTSLWDFVGPIDGTRFNITVGLTFGWNDMAVYNRSILMDFRKYLRLAKYSCYAFRFMGFSSSGKEPQRLYLGGSWTLRGYSRRSFYGRNLVLVNNELRFPLIDNLLIGFPFGRIGFKAIRGAVFFDAGNAWDDYTDETDDLHLSAGFGARVSLGYFMVLRFDFAKTSDSDGWVFDFFFGWNF
jgi:WD40 repeat protein